jgi:DNA-binding XRE family transcriptional regulator
VRHSRTPNAALRRAVGLRRREQGLRQEDLADAVEIDETTVRGIEGGVANPSWDVVDRIARALGWPLWRLARLAEELETEERRPTDEPVRRAARSQR